MLRSVRYGLYGLVLAGMVAAPAVWSGVDKTVHLVVDGKATSVTTTASRVGDLLSDRGYRTTRHDIVAPSTHSSLTDGMQVVLRRGRLLHLDVDGRRTDIWTTAPTVAIALEQLGYSAEDFVSVSRSRRLPLSPTSILIRPLCSVTVVHDGQTQQVSTTAPNVGTLLASMGVAMGPQDRSNVDMSTPVTDGQTIILQRVTTRTVSSTTTLKYATTKQADASMSIGDTETITSGRNGSARIYYSEVYVDGTLSGRVTLRTDILAAPRTQVIAYGTKKTTAVRIATAPVTVTGSSQAQAQAIAKQLLAQLGWSDQYSCVDNIFTRESNWRVHASNGGSGAYGIPQALPGSKMASAGPDWQDNATTQIKWGLNYMSSRYGSPCGAWSFWSSHGYY